ncbi:RIP metalloprotease RseP [Geobacter benzoatilyticus]|uniref:Zinc metalloprotease n=1 Tax=Geobacter benzoatilyticus TaxID=2815309 RepID=A0ABX7Q078_9BACT|nr:RIP metalloprotease RseP [Geobacter benzoatilyticus]QSV44797.1 RIP metalloprotease RseP [Geobacter benzoatilyticus]
MTSIVSAIIVLGILIFVHELGHFIFAKLFGVGVEKFSLGFGPKLIGKKIGETEYLLSAFPLGGYVKMVGEGGEGEIPEEEKARSFAEKSPLRRIGIVVAGPGFNLIFAWFLFIVIFMLGVPSATTKVGEVVKDKPAARAGMVAGDVVTAVNGKKVARWEEMAAEISAAKGQALDIEIRRGAVTKTFRIVPETRTGKNLLGENVTSPVIGVVAAGETVIDRYPPIEAFSRGSSQTWTVIELTALSLVKIVERAIPLDTIGGPIMIAKMAGQQAEAGGVSFLAFMALLSVNLGVLNLLPIPILDGGHLIFYLWELVFRKPVSMRAREIAQQVGLALLIGLMVLAFYNDIARYLVGNG